MQVENFGIHTNGEHSVVYDCKKWHKSDIDGYYRYFIGRESVTLQRHVVVLSGFDLKEDWEVHHKDFDRNNNMLSNLLPLPRIEHRRMHSEMESEMTLIIRRENLPMMSVKHFYCTKRGRKLFEHYYRKYEKVKEWKTIRHLCASCGNELGKDNYGIFCSNACKAKYRRDIGADDIEATCSYCGHTFKRNKYALRKKLEKCEKVFCSVRCATRDLGDRRHEDFVKEQAKNPPPPKPKKLKWFETEEGLEKHRRDMAMREKKIYTHVCKVCGDTYTNNSKNSSVCSTRCKQRAAFERGTGTVIAVCEICGEKYRKRKATVSHTCSRKCRGEYTRRKKAERKLAKMKEAQETMSEKIAQGGFVLDYECINMV